MKKIIPGGLFGPLRDQYVLAKQSGLWFYHLGLQAWFHPDELKDLNAKGRYRFMPHCWMLRDPEEFIAEAEERAINAAEGAARIRAEVKRKR